MIVTKINVRLAANAATSLVPVSPTTTMSVTWRIVQLRLVNATGQASARMRRVSAERSDGARMGRRP